MTALVVGCGIIGRHHGVVLTKHPSFTVTGLADPDPAMLDSASAAIVSAGGTAPTAYESLAEALEARAAEVVIICTPSGLHLDQALAALEYDVHLVIEKPLDVSVERARQLVDAAEQAADRGRCVSVISQHRFNPANVVVRDAIESGAFGQITSATTTMAAHRSQRYYDQGAWRGTWRMDGGGAVMNQGIHHVDLLRWLLGRPVEIAAHTAQLGHERIEIEDTATATIRFESGALATLLCTTAVYPSVPTRLQVHGSRGAAIVDDSRLEFFHALDGGPDHAEDPENQAPQRVEAGELRSSPRAADFFVTGHLRQYDDIADAITNKRPPVVTVTEALLSLALVRAIYLSAALGAPVRFDDVLEGMVETHGASAVGSIGGAI
ncbi:Gfo/Idh/MocA family oxidoreductase [Kribbella speibonae]|uniref:Gfo/Idh/MocA family oxidoreductase n=1 Tax=Kribbella speibonae TaxID=1572660 RepID=A0A4R0IE87_9ACTN|nr:Gfo/Idh/MocA family oxidoreductase [Kribbella speibonae]